MRNFIKNVLANLTAIFIVFFLFTFGIMIFITIASVIGNHKGVKIEKNSVLVLDQDLNIIESDTEEELSFLNFNTNSTTLNIHDITQAIKNAKEDPSIKGISIENDQINAGITQIDNIRTAIEDFKKSGKFVYSYGNNVSQPSYYLGSIADQYYLSPVGGIELKGMASEVIFFKDFAEKYGINFNVIRHGKFKAAVEPYLTNHISPENQEQLQTLLNDVWTSLSKKMAEARKIDSKEFQKITDSLYGIIPELSLKHKLVDKLLQKTEYNNLVKTKLGIEKDKELNQVSIKDYISTIENKNEKDQVAVLYASGEITDGDNLSGISSERYIEYIQELKENEQVKAVVLRINSPGGSANASDQILYELELLKQKKPLVVSFGDYAASGGYYIAMAGQRIFTEPNTITGSIGVFGMVPDVKNLANKNGIRADVVATNANSQMLTPVNGVTEGTKAMLKKNVEQTYKRFIHFVTQNRKKSFQQIDEIAEGRIWSGTRAKEIGLVDEIGSLDTAIAHAAKLAKLKAYSTTNYPTDIDTFGEFVKQLNSKSISTYFIKQKLGAEEFKIYETLDKLKNKTGCMMYDPFKILF